MHEWSGLQCSRQNHRNHQDNFDFIYQIGILMFKKARDSCCFLQNRTEIDGIIAAMNRSTGQTRELLHPIQPEETL
jgi:hypothetical protein